MRTSNGRVPDSGEEYEPDTRGAKTPRSSRQERQREDSEEVYEVEKVVGKMFDEQGRASYLLKWKNYDETTWEPVDNCECANLIESFEDVIKRNEKKKSR